MKQFVILFATVLALVSASIVPQPGFPEGRIINGHEAIPGEAAYIVSLQTTMGAHFCAGSVIHKSVLLTAAHCLIYQNFIVVLGAHELTSMENVQVREVTSNDYVIHEEYGGGVGPNDIGLIFLTKPLDLNAVARDGSNPVAAISLPSKTFEGTTSGTLYGWGRDNSGSLPSRLQKLIADIIDYDLCLKALPAGNKLADTNICTYTKGTADGACNGDSGGPLVTKTAQGTELVGIVSWGYTPCVSSQYPSMYTKVLSFVPWINENTAKRLA